VVLAAAIGAPCTTMWKNINVDTEVNAEMDNPTCDLGELSLNLRPPSFPLISYALMKMVDEFCKQLPDDLWNNFIVTVNKEVTIKSLAQGIVERFSLWIQSCGVPNALGPQNMVANQRLQDLIDEMDDLKNKLSKFGEKYLEHLRDKFESVVIKLEQLKEKQEVLKEYLQHIEWLPELLKDDISEGRCEALEKMPEISARVVQLAKLSKYRSASTTKLSKLLAKLRALQQPGADVASAFTKEVHEETKDLKDSLEQFRQTAVDLFCDMKASPLSMGAASGEHGEDNPVEVESHCGDPGKVHI